MTAGWYLSPDNLSQRADSGSRPAGWMVTGRVELTGAAMHAPRTTAFWYAPGQLAYEDRWRITSNGSLLWLETPRGHALDHGHGLTWTDRGDDGEPFPRPAPEVVTLSSLDRAMSRLGPAVEPRPPGSELVAGRPCHLYEIGGPRRARFVVDDETGFVLRVRADGIRGPHQIAVTDFAVAPLQPDLFTL